MKKKLSILLVCFYVISLLVGCGGGGATTDDPGTAVPPESTDEGLKTLTAGKLTIATGEPAYEPWIKDDKPESGEGFEAAVAYSVAEKLGFTKENVVWVRTQFEEAIQPGPKNFDLNLQQYSVTDERKSVVDFSSVYYKEPLAVIVPKSSAFATAADIVSLKEALFGAASADVAVDYTKNYIKPTKELMIYNDLTAVAQAMNAGQIDAMVVGVTTADYMVNFDEVENAVILGVLDGSENVTNGLAILLEKGSALTGPVTQAVDALVSDGTIQSLKDQWLGQYNVPLLK
jgi:polar amino acid transport system substrate-binding protein